MKEEYSEWLMIEDITVKKRLLKRSDQSSFSSNKIRSLSDANKSKNNQNNLIESDFAVIRSGAIDLEKLKGLALFFILMIIDQLLEGNDKFNSLIGVRLCSFIFWTFFIVFTSFCVYSSIFMKTKLTELNYDNKIFLDNPLIKDFNVVVIKTLIGGLIAGMVGIGGGIIMTPMMLDAGLSPKSTSNTSTLLLIFTSGVATFLFIFNGQLRFDYSIFIGIFCTISTMIGNNYIRGYVNRTKKNSLIIYFVVYILLISIVILPINGIRHIIYDLTHNVDSFSLKNYCSK